MHDLSDTCNGHSQTHEVTELLRAWRRGDRSSYDRLIDKIHNQLHQLAEMQLAGQGRDLLQPTELVNMAYLKLMGAEQVDWQDRNHFFGVAAQAMRWLVMDWVRKYRLRESRGAVLSLESLADDQFEKLVTATPEMLLALDEALTCLEAMNPRYVRLVELRCFAGFSLGKAANILGISRVTASRNWKFVKAWLHNVLYGKGAK